MVPKDHLLKWTHRKILETHRTAVNTVEPCLPVSTCALRRAIWRRKNKEERTFTEYLQREVNFVDQYKVALIEGLLGAKHHSECFACIIYWPNPQTALRRKNYSYHPTLQIKKLPWLSHPANMRCSWIHSKAPCYLAYRKPHSTLWSECCC